MTNQRNRQTRQQRKRETMRMALMAAATILFWALLTVWAFGIWAEHPGEQPVSGRTYLASIQMDGEPVW